MIAVVQIGAVDGMVLPMLADELAGAADVEQVLAIATTIATFDFALIGL